MRADRRPDREDTAGSSLSRRTFVLAGGTVAGAAIASGTGTVVASDETDHVVAATEPYLSAVRAVAESYGGPTVSVRPADETVGESDLRVSGRPVEDGDTARAVATRRRAALARPEGEWRECRCRSDLRDRWRSDVPVETWSESERVDVADPNPPASGTGPSGTAGSVFVRGTRSYQYADGRGGVGYYGVNPTELRSLPADPDEYTPVVRLTYFHFEQDALSSDGLLAFLRSYGRDTANVAAFFDPAVEVR